MSRPFVSLLCFHVKVHQTEKFEQALPLFVAQLRRRKGCIDIHTFKRQYTMNGIDAGELKPMGWRHVVQTYAYWCFDDRKNTERAMRWLHRVYGPALSTYLVMPIQIESGMAITD